MIVRDTCRGAGQYFVALMLMVIGCLVTPQAAHAADRPINREILNREILNREILGLYDSTKELQAEETRLHLWLEMPLNHLGYKLTLHDIAKGLPPVAEAKRYHAVITWFSDRVIDADRYLVWATQAARSGVKFVVIDSVGMLGDKGDLPRVNAFLTELDLAFAEYYVSDSSGTRIKTIDAAMTGFEHKLDPERLPGHQVVIAKSSAIKVHLSVTDPAHQWVKAPSSILVATSPKGGFIASGFAVRYDDAQDLVRWIVDPFKFLEAALGSKRRPIPDTTTISGRRIYFSHIDGDGWNNLTEVHPYSAERGSAAEVVLDTLIAPYPDLPVSVGLIAGDVDPDFGGVTTNAGIAQAMYVMPHVEVASHTHSHPYDWKYFENYDRDREITDVLSFASSETHYDDRSLRNLVAEWRNALPVDAKDARAVTHEGVRNAQLPRARPHHPFDLALEVHGALAAASELAPEGKRANLFLWSGNTRPFEAAVRETRLAGVRNLNGGDSRFDSAFPSVAYVAPLSRVVGAERQFYAVDSNENTYTNGWTGPFDAFRLLKETVDNTETPRRLKGFNLYYHAFSATKQAGLDSILGHLDYARTLPIAPITASHYAGIAEGFFSARIAEAGRDRWRISQRGDLDTVRFDAADDVVIDYIASTGVIGHTHHAGSLYVALDRAVREPVVALRSADRTALKPDHRSAHLIDGRWQVSALSRSRCNIAASVQGFGAGDMTWGGLAPGDYIVMVRYVGETIAEHRATAEQDGRLTFRLDADAVEPVELEILCATPSAAPIPSRAAGPLR